MYAGELLWVDGVERTMGEERRPWLLFVRKGEVRTFSGESIEGFCTVRGKIPREEGWRSVDYLIRCSPGTRALYGWEDWGTGRFLEGATNTVARGSYKVTTWRTLGRFLHVSVEEAKRFLREWRPEEADWLDSKEDKKCTRSAQNAEK